MFPRDSFEWPDEVEIFVDRLENLASERALSREERAVLDVYETVLIIDSEDGLHEFWHSAVDHQRIIKSFDLMGASSLVDPLNASRWCGSCNPERGEYSETESDYLATIEEELPTGLEDITDLMLDFIEEELS